MRQTSPSSLAKVLLPSAAALLLTGCGLGVAGTNTTAAATGVTSLAKVSGNVHGGQQPVAGAAINIYAVGTTGYGSPSVSLLNNGVVVKTSTDGGGSFSLTGKFTCTPEQRIYITATGGDAGSGTNPALALMAALGRCGDNYPFVSLNEVTTVASVWALAPFMSDATHVGAPLSNTTGINNAFADVNVLASISQGAAGGTLAPAGTVIPVASINTLADILAACVNSNGATTACSTLFSGASVGGVAPTNTITAAVNIAKHPSTAVATLFPLSSPQSPFQPTLPEAPTDFTLAATFAPGLSSPSAAAADASGNLWVTDASANKLVQLSHTGAPLQTITGLSAPSAIAIDQTGNAWLANAGNSTLARVTPSGALSTFTGGGLSTPQSISIDGPGNIWLANPGNATLSEFSPTGTPLSGSGFTLSGATPIAVAPNPN